MSSLLDISLHVLQSYSYFFIFLLMFIEGRIVTLIFSFLSSFGFFNIFIIFVLAVLGNVIPDFIYFSIGKVMRKKSVEEIINRFGFGKEGIVKLEKNIKVHTKKTIIVMKLTPFLAVPGIMLAGFLKLPYKRFFSVSIPLDFIMAFIFSAMGYFSGMFGLIALKQLQLEGHLIPIVIFLLVVVSLVVRWGYKIAIGKIKKIK